MRRFKLIVNVPLSHTDAVRQALGDAGAGKMGDYSHCSFSYRGTGRFKAGQNADPYIGKPGEFTAVEEERIEVSYIPEAILTDVIAAMKAAHPYEETAYEVIELFNAED